MMRVPNHERKALKDMTPEERSAIVEAWIDGYAEVLIGDIDWGRIVRLDLNDVYRIRTQQLAIPWKSLDKKYQWAALDEDGTVWAYEFEPFIIGPRWSGGHAKRLDRYAINTDGIDWRYSPTTRPESV